MIKRQKFQIYKGGVILKNNEYHRFEKEYIPIRLYEASKNVPKKIKLYDDLKKNKIIWKIAMCLVKISKFL